MLHLPQILKLLPVFQGSNQTKNMWISKSLEGEAFLPYGLKIQYFTDEKCDDVCGMP